MHLADYLITKHSIFLLEIKQRTPHALLMLKRLLFLVITKTTDKSQTSTDESQTSLNDYRRVTDESQTTTDESQTTVDEYQKTTVESQMTVDESQTTKDESQTNTVEPQTITGNMNYRAVFLAVNMI